MCEFSDWLGLLSMSPYEQWQLLVRILTVGSVGLGAVWGIWNWLTSKKIEFELTILENSGRMQAYYEIMGQHNYGERGIEPSDNIRERIKVAAGVAELVSKKNVSFRELRHYAKQTVNIRHYIETIPAADRALTERNELRRRRTAGPHSDPN